MAGIGIGCTGPVDPRSGEIGEVDFLPGWRGRNPVAELAKRYPVEVAMENDADAAVLGELAWGAGRERRNLISVTVGTGIGGGIVLDGALYRGVGGSHPEVGHHVIDASGPECSCGSRGCWEACARGPEIAARVLREAPAHYPHRAGLTAQRVCELAREGDAVATTEVAREGRYLGIGIANLVTLFVPEIIVLSGSVMESADLFLPIIRETVRSGCGLVPADSVQITTSALGRHAGLIGAGAVWHHRRGALQ
jgi:glucokinase